MNRIKLALSAFWSILTTSGEYWHLFHTDRELTSKQKSGIEAIITGQSHSRRYPKRKQGRIGEGE